jgi:two-component system response regulator GlrR
MSEHQSSLGVSRIDATAAELSTTAAITNPPRATGRRRSDRVISASALMQEIVDQASGIARSEEPVIVSGPSGSGRKHIARAVHQWSSRAGGPLVEIQVAGTSEPIQLRELFGDDASGQPGALSRAQGGSLLIESADQLSAQALARLLGDLGAGGRARLLATVAADAESALGGIRGHAIRLAPLSARVEDILPLAAHFLAEFAARESFDAVGFSADARRWLVEEPWTGNVRELRERIRQAIRLAGNGAISAEALMLSADGDDVPSFKEAKRAFETRYVEGLLRRCSGNISRAARMAKKDRKDFYDVIRRTGVDPTQFRG